MILRTSSILILLSVVTLALSGCQRDDDDRNTGYGTMNILLSANSSVIEVGASSNTRSNSSKADSIAVAATRAESVVPVPEDFSLMLYKEKLVVSQWDKFSEFSSEEKIAVGQYVLKATYGNLEKEGLNSPYYEGSTSLSIREREVTDAEIVCSLANVKVSIVCTESVKRYFKSFVMQMRSDVGKMIDVSKDETDPFYLKPGLLVLNAQFEKQNSTTPKKVELLRLSDTEARQHYTITIDVNGGETGSGTLNVTYNSVKSEEDVNIDLSDASLNIKEPVFTPQGFDNRVTKTLREGSEPEAMKVTLNARAGIKTCELTIHAPYLMEKMGFAESVTVDLASKEQKHLSVKQQLESYGLRLIGLNDNLEKLALIDFAPLVMSLLCTGDADEKSTFTLRATDVGGRVEEQELVLDILMQSNQFSFPEIEDVVMIGSTEASVKVRLLANEGSLNGKVDVENVIFEYQDEAGQWVKAKSVWDGDDWDDEVLHYAIIENLPEIHTKLKLRARYGSKESQVQTLNYYIPEFSLTADEVDIWPRKATIKVEAKTDEEREAVLKYFKLMNGDSEMKNVTQSGNTFLCEGLEPGAKYNLLGICNGDNAAVASYPLQTESAIQLPNSNFEQWKDGPYNGEPINKGGPWAKRGAGVSWGNGAWTTYETYQPANLSVEEPEGWATVNAKTMPKTSGDQWNTWYVVPSTEKSSEDKNCVRIKNVGWHHAGEKISSLGEIGYGVPNVDSYASFPGFGGLKTPSTLKYSAGRLFLGTYSYDHTSKKETYIEGYPFTSRPAKLVFKYKYISKTSALRDRAYVRIRLKSGVDVLYEKYLELANTSNALVETINFTYPENCKKATDICVMFCSTKDAVEQDQSIETDIISHYDIGASEYKEQTCVTGSELYVYNIELIY